MNNTKTLSDCIKDFQSMHGDNYDYSEVRYVKSNIKVKVGCKINGHPAFFITPNNHRNGVGCPICGKLKSSIKCVKTFESFREIIETMHGNKYSFDGSKYVNRNTKLPVSCSVEGHPDFSMTPSNMLNGEGCRPCGVARGTDSRMITFEIFLERARKRHGDKFQYPDPFIDRQTRCVRVVCVQHGEFSVNIFNHLKPSSNGSCKECAKDSVKRANSWCITDFIKQAESIHGNRYNYDQFIYSGYLRKGLIICKHGHRFLQAPSNHLGGANCPHCTIRISKPCSQWLDGLGVHVREWRIPGTKFTADGYSPSSNTVYEFYGSYWHGDPSDPRFQHDKIHPVVKRTFGELYNATIEKEKVIKSLGYNIVTIWESEWYRSAASKNLVERREIESR